MAGKQSANSLEIEAMSLITENLDKLKILLSASKTDKPLKYKFKGKRSTKTVFMSIKLQYLLNEFCIERDVKIGDVIENAVVEFLVKEDWTDKLREILGSAENTGGTGGIA